jgi:uncharacterized membrane-anchored protein
MDERKPIMVFLDRDYYWYRPLVEEFVKSELAKPVYAGIVKQEGKIISAVTLNVRELTVGVSNIGVAVVQPRSEDGDCESAIFNLTYDFCRSKNGVGVIEIVGESGSWIRGINSKEFRKRTS